MPYYYHINKKPKRLLREPKSCVYCNQKESNEFYLYRCCTVYYCDVKCQEQDFNSHSKNCPRIEEVISTIDTTIPELERCDTVISHNSSVPDKNNKQRSSDHIIAMDKPNFPSLIESLHGPLLPSNVH